MGDREGLGGQPSLVRQLPSTTHSPWKDSAYSENDVYVRIVMWEDYNVTDVSISFLLPSIFIDDNTFIYIEYNKKYKP